MVNVVPSFEPLTAVNGSEPLVTRAELSVWTRQDPLEEPLFADVVLDAASFLVREAGLSTWTVATVPYRARLICILLAKDYYLNPDGVQSETVGPLSERKIEDVLRGLRLTEDEESELAELAGKDDPTPAGGLLWSQSTTRGPLETHRRRGRDDSIRVLDHPYGSPLPLYAADDPYLPREVTQ